MNAYQSKSTTTRSRRQAAGRYATAAQKAAVKRYISGGRAALLPGDAELIAAHPQMGSFRV